MRSVWRSDDERGTASLEAVLVLAVFLVVYVGVLHMAKLQHGVLLARAQARSCAWRYSNAGCHDGPPPGCAEQGVQRASLNPESDDDQGLLDVIAPLGLLRGLFDQLLGASADVHVARTVPSTALLNDQDVEVSARIYLLCNERKRTAPEIAKDTACALMPDNSFMGSVLGCRGGRSWQE